MTKANIHRFAVQADTYTGEWDLSTIEYLGEMIKADYLDLADSDEFYHDQHDGAALDARFWDVAGIDPTSANVGVTIIWK